MSRSHLELGAAESNSGPFADHTVDLGSVAFALSTPIVVWPTIRAASHRKPTNVTSVINRYTHIGCFDVLSDFRKSSSLTWTFYYCRNHRIWAVISAAILDRKQMEFNLIVTDIDAHDGFDF